MKTLKKTLCLVLAVVLALGVMVLPAYADKETYDNFEDKDTISAKYAEAVGALTGLGVINGRDDNVEPQAYINRAEAVTMVVRAVLGKAAATLAKADTKFADVTKSHYASQYVQYAVENGIVAGKSETEFKPDDLVTGYELARMALVAADIKTDFTSAAWQNQTGVAASKAELLEGLEHITNLNDALTREESAQLIWKAVTYVPEGATLKVTGTKSTGGTATDVDYTVTYPEESIGGKVYKLESRYSWKSGAVYVNEYGNPSVRHFNKDTNEVYYEGAVSAITDFYVKSDSLTVGNIKTELGKKTTDLLKARVYVDGYSEKSNEYKVINETPDTDLDVDNKVDLTDNGTTKVADRGAHVVIFKGYWGGVDYLIYISYTYAAYNGKKTDNAYATSANSCTSPGNPTTLPLGKMDAGTIATFGITRYPHWTTTNVKVHEAAANVNIVRKSNNSNDPYFYLSNNPAKKVYASAMAIYVDEDGVVAPLTFKPYIDVSGDQYFDVWYDNDGNVLALVEANPANPADLIKYTDFGYVLEFSSTKATGHFDDMETVSGTDTPATAEVVMVNLKSGKVGIYKLDVQYNKTTKTWDAMGINGKVNFAITTTVTGVTENTYGQTVLHGFVAYKQLATGNYGITAVDKLDSIGSTDYDFDVYSTFTTSRTYPGRVDVGSDILYADANTEVRVLSHKGHTTLSDGSRVNNYPVTALTGYASLDNIEVFASPTEKCDNAKHEAEIVGVDALFCYDSKTKMITQAYVFGDQTLKNPVKTYDYWVLVERDDSYLDGGTMFTFLHDGEVVKLHADDYAVAEMELQFDNALDAGTVCHVEYKGSELIDVTPTADAQHVDTLTCDGFSNTSDGTYYGFINTDDGKENAMRYLTKGCWVFDKTLVEEDDPADASVDTVHVGDTVTVYYATDEYKEISLIVITAHNPAE